jgi:hypothetical protein
VTAGARLGGPERGGADVARVVAQEGQHQRHDRERGAGDDQGGQPPAVRGGQGGDEW